jgi:hypothetical protein
VRREHGYKKSYDLEVETCRWFHGGVFVNHIKMAKFKKIRGLFTEVPFSMKWLGKVC